MDLKNTTNLIEEFWKWFGQNDKRYRKIVDDYKTDLIDNILGKLTVIQKGLAVEFEKLNEIYVLTVPADGIEENFEIVQKIIDRAPSINSWKFIAFRQPYDKERLQELVLTIDGYSLDPKQIMFLPIAEEEKLYIQIFSRDIDEQTESKIGYGCLMLLDNIIGEYACVKKVNGYEYYNLTDAKGFESELKPLTEIRDYLDFYYQDK